MEEYKGSLTYKKMTPLALKAYQTILNQRSRCNYKNNIRYDSYGGKGIRVEYSSRQFVGWYLSEYPKKAWKDVTVGRIDHEKNYCFSNIRLEERSDNSRDSSVRYWRKPGPKPKTFTKVEIFCRCCNKSVKIFNSVTACAKYLEVDRTAICLSIKRNSKLKKISLAHLGIRKIGKSRTNITYE